MTEDPMCHGSELSDSKLSALVKAQVAIIDEIRTLREQVDTLVEVLRDLTLLIERRSR